MVYHCDRTKLYFSTIFQISFLFNPLPHNPLFQRPPRKKPFDNVVGKGEDTVNQHFHLFPQCFLHYKNKFLFCVMFILSSANASSFDKSKILLLGKELIIIYIHSKYHGHLSLFHVKDICYICKRQF